MANINGTSGNDHLKGDTIFLLWDDVINGFDGNDLIEGLLGNDVLHGGNGNDDVRGGDGNDQIFGDAGDDILTGGLGADAMFGGSGNDQMTLNAIDEFSSEVDHAEGGTGDDIYMIRDHIPLFAQWHTIVEKAGEGTDTVFVNSSYILGDNIENLVLKERFSVGTVSDNTRNTIGEGNALSNRIEGSSGSNELRGLGSSDVLIGLAGDDLLNGGTGADRMEGGTGNDTYIVDRSDFFGADLVVENPGEGIDGVNASVSFTLSANVENLSLVGSALNGTGNSLNNQITGNLSNNVLTGLGGNDHLIGNAGNDRLDGGSGFDDLDGGSGDDVYVVDSVFDVVTDAAGTDRIESSISWSLASHSAGIENLTLIGTSSISGTGNADNNRLTGNAGGNLLSGGGGADIMAGGAGSDTYVTDGNDTITELLDGGTDLVLSSVSLTLGANLENLTLTGSSGINGTGNALNNVITGNAGLNSLTGGDGNDVLRGGGGGDFLFGGAGNDTLDGGNGDEKTDEMHGGAGDDLYIYSSAPPPDPTAVVMDVVVELTGEGTDTIQSGNSVFILDANVENIVLTGSGSTSANGNDLANAIAGNSGNNILKGFAGDDTLTGNAGDDRLEGGEGADNLQGGIGDDTYVVDNAADRIADTAGVDTVESSISWSLAFSSSSAENLTLTGSSNTSAFGTSGSNILVGNAGVNLLNGLGGSDTMRGGGGDDTYVASEDDTVIENTADGIDTVQSTTSFTLPANVENLILSPTVLEVEDGTGNELANNVTGNDAQNALSGEGGDDVLAGGGGDDHLFGGAGNDRLLSGSGVDEMYGNAGGDAFTFVDTGDSVPGSRDVIGDFTQLEDVVDLSSIDADIATDGNQSFRFIGSQTFHSIAGELRANLNANGNTILRADVDGNGNVDFAIELTGSFTLTEADFVL